MCRRSTLTVSTDLNDPGTEPPKPVLSFTSVIVTSVTITSMIITSLIEDPHVVPAEHLGDRASELSGRMNFPFSELPRPDCPDQEPEGKIENLKLKKQDAVVSEYPTHYHLWLRSRRNGNIRIGKLVGSEKPAVPRRRSPLKHS